MTEQDPIAAWVARLNRLGRKMDDLVYGTHPSAWPEMTAKMREEFRRLVSACPEIERDGLE